MDGSHSLPIRSDSSLALRCRKGPSTPSLDHLVGDGEHAWAHFEAKRPRRLKIDDELEPRRLQHWEIGRLRAFKDAAGVHADLTTHLELVGSVAHQPAGGDIAPLRITRWYPLAGGQDRKLHTAAAEESVGPDKESIGTLARKRGKGSIDLASCGGLQYPKLKPDDRAGLLQVPQCVLGGRRIGRIDKHGNTSSRGDQLMQEPQPLGCHLFGEKINSRRIAPPDGQGWPQDQVGPGRPRHRIRLGSSQLPLWPRVAGPLPGIAITVTGRRTKSAISAGNRSYRPSSQWYSTATFCPST